MKLKKIIMLTRFSCKNIIYIVHFTDNMAKTTDYSSFLILSGKLCLKQQHFEKKLWKMYQFVINIETKQIKLIYYFGQYF